MMEYTNDICIYSTTTFLEIVLDVIHSKFATKAILDILGGCG